MPTHSTPIYCLDDFSKKADHSSFYTEKLSTHLVNHPFVSKPHKHDFYLILYIIRGGGTHTIDFQTYPITKGGFYLMTPGQVHSWALNADTEGYILFFRKDFYQLNLDASSPVDFPFFHSLNASPFIDIKNDSTIDFILEEILREFHRQTQPDHRMLRAYLDLLLLKLSRVYKTENEVPLHDRIYKLRKLEQLIDKHFIKLKQPREYADLMHLSPSYLNTLCKQNLNKTLGDLIQERILLEIKRLLAYTDFSLKQIADKLNFSDPSYLIRFFKKNTGFTPEQFKESINRAV
jgi:AraC family transcriptional activator of pobA